MLNFKNLFKEKVNIYKNVPKKLALDNPKKVSAVIPNYNYANYIIERIDSILQQTYPIYELVIIDDKSTDNSVEVIDKKLKKVQKKYSDLKVSFIKRDTNSGNVFCGWQNAFKYSTGDFLWICEADDSCSPLFLENVMKGFDNPNTILSYCESLTMDENNVILMKDLREWIDIFQTGKWNEDYDNTGDMELASTLCINNTIANVSGAVFRKLPSVNFEEMLKTAQTFRLAGDWYFYTKVLEHGDIHYCKTSLNYHRMQSKSVTLTTSAKQEYEEICRIQDDIMKRVTLSEEVKERVMKRRADKRRCFEIEEQNNQ